MPKLHITNGIRFAALRPSTRRVGGLRSARSVAVLAPTPHSATVCQPWPCSASPYSGWQTVVYNRERYVQYCLNSNVKD